MMNNLKKLYRIKALLLIFIGSTSCDYINRLAGWEDEEVIVKCFDSRLYKKDINTIITDQLSEEDSIKRVKAYIDRWIIQQTIVHFAKQDTLIDLDEIDHKVKEYANQLIYHTYQKALVKHKSDTTVSDREIETYYNENKNDFVLQQPAVRVVFLSIYREQESLPKVKKWLYSNEEGAIDSLVKLGQPLAQQYITDYDTWHYWKNITKNTPLKNIKDEEIVSDKSVLEESDENLVYFVKVIDVLNKGEYAPIALNRKKIKHKILTERKQQLLVKYKDSFLEKAHEKNAIHVYN